MILIIYFIKKNVNLFKDESGPKFSLRNYLISIKKGFWQPAMICLLLSGRDESFSLSIKNDRFFLKTTKKKNRKTKQAFLKKIVFKKIVFR